MIFETMNDNCFDFVICYAIKNIECINCNYSYNKHTYIKIILIIGYSEMAKTVYVVFTMNS